MRIFTKGVALGLLIAMIFSFVPVWAAASLSDIEGHGNQDAIEYLFNGGVIEGYPDGTFKPGNTVNRAELLKILVGGTGNQPVVSEYKNCFPDVKSEWFAPFVCFAKEQGWVEGYPDGTFRPGQTVNKVEAIKMLDESQGYKLEDGVGESAYTDVDAGQWYADYVAMAIERNLLEEESVLGVSDGMSRAGISEMIYRAMLLNEVEVDAELFADEGESSGDLIDEDYAAKKIDLGESYLYKLYALYDDEKLPSKYESDVVTVEANDLMEDILENYDDLSSVEQDDIDPFLKRPEDPESYLSQRYAGEVAMDGALIAATRPSATLYSASLITADNNVRIWYPNQSLTMKKLVGTGELNYDTATFLGIATKIKNMFDNDNLVQRYDTLMGRSFVRDGTRSGDELLDIYVSPVAHLGLATPDTAGTPTSGFLQINPALNDMGDKYIRATVAHELFHMYQNAFKHNWNKDHWWKEASATWAMEFAYGSDNVEHVFLKRFIPYPGVTLYQEAPPGTHAYAAYIFGLYLTNLNGDSIIRDVWEACETKLCLDALDSTIDGGFKQQWRKFTLWNFNRAPAKHYTDKSGYFPGLTSGDTAHEVQINMSANEEEIDIDTAEIKPLSAQLIKATNMVGASSDVKKVAFKDFSNFTALSDKASIYAVIYYHDKGPIVEDWTDKSRRTFCLDNASSSYENFDEIYLIFANGEKSLSLDATKITAQGHNSCGGNWHGTVKMTGNYNGSYECDWMDRGDETEVWSLKIEEELEENSLLDALDGGNINYDILKQDVTYSYTQSKKDVEVFDLNDETVTETLRTGSGRTVREPDSTYSVPTDLGEIVMGRSPRFVYYPPLPDAMMGFDTGDLPDDQYVMELENLGGNLYGTSYGMCDFANFTTTVNTDYSNGDSDSDTYVDNDFCNESALTYDMEDELWPKLKEIDRPIEDGKRIKGKVTLTSDQFGQESSFKGNCDGDAWNYTVVIEWDYKKG